MQTDLGMTQADLVSSIMRREFVSLDLGDTLDFAGDVMSLGQIRHLPVLENGRLVGIVSQRDLLANSLSKLLESDAGQQRRFLRNVRVTDVMNASPITVGPDTPTREAARLMLRHRVGCLPVVGADGMPVGLLSETDLLRVAYSDSADG